MDTSTPTTPQLLLRIPEAARALGISTRSVYTIASAGKLKILKIGKSSRISTADVNAYVDGLRLTN